MNKIASIPCPIHDIELEKSVLVTIISSYQSLIDSSEILSEDCFYEPRYKEIYCALKRIQKTGVAPNMILVANELMKCESSISTAEVTELCMTSTVVFDIVPHAMILRDYAFRRKLWETGYKIFTEASSLGIDVETIQSHAKDSIDGLFGDGVSHTETLASSYRDLQTHMMLNHSLNEGEILGSPTGFQYIDKNGGLCGGELIVVGAETSQGKTSFATALSLGALLHGDGVAVYSMEMSPMQITARIASMRTGIPVSKILYNKLELEEIYRIDAAMECFDGSNMYFDGRSNTTLDSIKLSIRNMKMRHNIKGAVVDYLQLVNVTEKALNREQAVASCARGLKNLATELDIWIIAISQLSRSQSGIPTLSRLRDSGEIEHAADKVFLIYRPRNKMSYPEPFEDITTTGTAMVYSAKGRNTGIGEFICGFVPENTLFYPLSDIDLGNLKEQTIHSSGPDNTLDEEVPF